MNSELSADNEQFVGFAVASGIYHDRSEAIDTAVGFLRHRFELIRDVNNGIEQLERGEGRPLDIEAVKAAVRREFEAQ
jgi:Arc/MetJ-type ribon-helix-helix transcriptional regulator